jgi:hypothetical protein
MTRSAHSPAFPLYDIIFKYSRFYVVDIIDRSNKEIKTSAASAVSTKKNECWTVDLNLCNIVSITLSMVSTGNVYLVF